MTCRIFVFISVFLLLSSQPVFSHAQDVDHQSPKILPDTLPNGSSPGTMVRDSLLKLASGHFEKWKIDFERLNTPQQISDYQQTRRIEFIQHVGGLPERFPLRPQITGHVHRDGYSVEKVLFESQPNFYVTAALFLPTSERFMPPWPAVIILCGHAEEGKLQDGYQRGAALAAINGIAALIVDPIGQGERQQFIDSGETPMSPTTEHSIIGTAAIPLGWNTARWMVHDAMRSIDYLQSRPDIRSDRIGVMGNSGGGTQTSYLMAIDERVVAAAPSCYLTSLQQLLSTIGPQDAEQNIHGQIEWGLDHADFILMRAPRPTLIACATRDYFDIEGTWATYRYAKRLYERLGAARSVEIVEADSSHGWHPTLRRASVQFLCQHLAGRLSPIADPEVTPLSIDEMQVTPRGQVLRLPGAVSVFDHLREESQRLHSVRRSAVHLAGEFAKQVRRLAGVRELAAIPRPEQITLEDAVAQQHARHPMAERASLQVVLLKTDQDVCLPGLLARPYKPTETNYEREVKSETLSPVCLFLEEGAGQSLRVGSVIEQRIAKGQIVLAIDIRGVGETEPVGKFWYNQRFGRNGGNAMLAYLQGHSLVGLRAEDCLIACRWLSEQTGGKPVDAVATGELTVPALHAAALEPELIDCLELHGGLNSWTDLTLEPLSISPISNVVHAALRVYDLPDLINTLGERVTTIATGESNTP